MEPLIVSMNSTSALNNGRKFSTTSLGGRRFSTTSQSGRRYSSTTQSGKNISTASLSGRKISNASLSGRRISNSSVSGRRISNVSLSGRRVSNSSLSGRRISNVSLSGRRFSSFDGRKVSTASYISTVSGRVKKEGDKKWQYLAALSATLGAFGLGTVMGYTSPALPKMNLDPSIEITPADASWVGSLVNIGALMSGPATGYLIGRYGRKPTMMALAIPFVIGWLLIAYASNVWMLYIGRLVTGFSGGSFSVAAPVYIAETAEVSVRGALGSYFQLMVTIGILFTYVVGSFISWSWSAIVNAIIPIVFVACFYFMPESPSYLVTVGRTDDALDSLQVLRGPEHNVEPELSNIETQARALLDTDGALSDLFKGVNLKLTVVALGLMLFQQLSGINAVIFYSADIFIAAGMSLNPNASAVIVGVVQCVATYCSSLLVDRAGRKILLLISGTVMGISLVLLGVYFFLGNKDIGFLPLFSLILFIISFSIGYGPIPWMMMGELFPLEVKDKASSVAATFNWSLSFIVTLSFSPLITLINAEGVYWLFSGVCFVGVVFVFVFVKETKGKAQEQILREYGA